MEYFHHKSRFDPNYCFTVLSTWIEIGMESKDILSAAPDFVVQRIHSLIKVGKNTDRLCRIRDNI